MRWSIQEVARCVAGLAPQGQSVLVGIDGCAGSGKTTFARRLAIGLGDLGRPVSVVHTDLIYRPVADRWQGHIDDMPIGYDLDWQRLRDEVLEPLRAGRTAQIQLYDWVADRLNEWVRIDAGGVTVVDGVFAMRRELLDYYDLRIWFSCPREVREPRLLNRGDTSRGELEYWFPIEERYVAAQIPEPSADLVIDGSPEQPADGGSDWMKVLRWTPPSRHRGERPIVARPTHYEASPGQILDPVSAVVACGESQAPAFLIDQAALPPEFFDLSTGIAGELLHKLSVYRLRLAAVVPDPSVHSDAFQGFIREANRGRQFRFFRSRADAIDWLESDGHD